MVANLADVIADIAQHLEPFRKDGQPITAATDISRDLNIDSLAIMDLMMALEDKYNVSIPLNVVPDIRTVDDLARTVAQMKEAA